MKKRTLKHSKIISLLIAAMMIVASLPFVGISALAEESGGFRYEILDDGTAEITGYNVEKTEISIPSTINGYTVTSIIGLEMDYGPRIKSISIPSSVTNIDTKAFSLSYEMESITVDSANKNYSSQDGVLFNKDKTELIQYPIANERTSYTVPNSVKVIGRGAFSHSTNLTEVYLGNEVQTISDYAFNTCSFLDYIKLDYKLESIGSHVFSHCPMSRILIPDSVTQIDADAFYMSHIETIAGYEDSYAQTYAEENGYDFDSLGKKSGDFRYVILEDGTAAIIEYTGTAAEVVIPSTVKGYTVTRLGGPNGVGGFYEDTNIVSVTIPNTVTEIGNDVFYGCENLKNVNIPESVTSIGSRAFIGTAIKSMVIPKSVKEIGLIPFPAAEKIYILNEKLDFPTDRFTWNYFAPETVVYGYNGSTVQAYANMLGNEFIDIDDLEAGEIIAEDTDGKYILGSENGASIHCTSPVDEFISVTVNGNAVNADCYKLTEGSTILTFKPEYLDALGQGVYEVVLNFVSGSVTTTLTVANEQSESPAEPENPSDSEKPTTNENATPNKPAGTNNTSPNTGANTAALGAFSATAVIGLALVVLKKKCK